MAAPIDLAHEPSFAIGALEIHPPTHEVSRDGLRHVIEPRVMQVLIALARADGGVVTRDELGALCWNGRVVGDDAIHRVLSRLRRLGEGFAGGAFRIETITRVGYRLVRPDAEGAPAAEARADAVPAGASPSARLRAPLARRALLAVGAGAALVAGGALWWAGPFGARTPSEAEALLARARESLRDGTPDQNAAAVSLLRRAVDIAPADAECWGALSLAYQEQAVRSGSTARDQIEARCRNAASRALALDPGNGDAMTALATLSPFYRRWSAYEGECRRVLARHPGHATLNRHYGHFLDHVGRSRAALPLFDRAMAADSLSPQLHWQRIMSLWTAGRLDEADAAMDRAIGLWPRHYALWFVRIRLLNHTGRTAAASAMIDDPDTRPIGIPEWNFALGRKEARALQSRAAADVDAAVAAYREAARTGAGFAENAIVFASAAGRLDEAFTVAAAYFFDRGATIGDQRFAPEQGIQGARRQRYSAFLFTPPAAAMRADPRFEPLVREIGLDDYWRRAMLAPDYRQA
jgi:DNA-binding winged helix-turn-helix (wHTH) protein/Tfp pilus assembly protein PilF